MVFDSTFILISVFNLVLVIFLLNVIAVDVDVAVVMGLDRINCVVCLHRTEGQ